MGAWIEIKIISLPGKFEYTVAPYMGAWIEIEYLGKSETPPYGRTLHGCVD